MEFGYLLKFCKWFFLISGTGGNSDAIADYFSQLTQSEVDDDDDEDDGDGGDDDDDDYDYFSQLTQCWHDGVNDTFEKNV